MSGIGPFNGSLNSPFGSPPGPFGGGGGFGMGQQQPQQQQQQFNNAPLFASPAPSTTFGAPPAAATTTTTTTAFGSAFTNPASAAPAFGGGGGQFAAPSAAPFAASNNASSSPFHNSNPFAGGGGGTGGGFGGNAAMNHHASPFAAPASSHPFGSPSATTSSFPNNNNTTNFSNNTTAFSTPATSGWPAATPAASTFGMGSGGGPFGNSTDAAMHTGTNASSGPFGTPAPVGAPPSSHPFGGTPQATAPFATTNTATGTGGPFGQANNNNNMNQGTTMSSSSSSNPFMTSAAPATPIVFGTATSSVAAPPPPAAPATTPFAQASTTTTPMVFAQPAPAAPPGTTGMAVESDTRDKNKKKKKGNQQQSRSDLPFGTPPQSTPGAPSASGAAGNGESEEERKKRTALLEKKKKKLEELKRKKEQEAAARAAAAAAASQSNALAPPSALNPQAASFVPSQPQQQRQPPSSNQAQAPAPGSLAERNAARFDQSSANAATRALLPPDLQAKAGQAVDYSALRSGGGDRGNLHQAKSLVGTCPHMCPDEELLRREREGDIQLLEMVAPGTIHPQGWTLRNTAIKRFRRSAADYKLDVPEWVRPPDVLENVCGYLEEWIMERDRQSGDARFKDGAPAPLDVYQFIWDRTRMIRKDFTLQNYVGTGGNCDARAVRCHERIARWHAMCEHQLSHIKDFVVMQSQQNVQELGQTMKTLNQFYDDALKRSRVEVPDKDGRETRTDLTGFSHGCAHEAVQGTDPCDYDGTALKNSRASSVRLVGKNGAQKYHHGTAEPEMRGLYILLTIDNDGGMEVMRYAAHLSRERPEIFGSVPVQLALKVYKAKKEGNYATFFRVLRSSATPYLFACIMFKYVPQMRRAAFLRMSRTYGGRGRDATTGALQTVHDGYPLRDLRRLLCFEDEEEALAACKHYGITVKESASVKSPSGTPARVHMIFWRTSKFDEPKDPDKGTPIPLRPKKMISTIEAKRKGATRLAVCRGDVSGIGAFLQGDAGQSASQGSDYADLVRQQARALQSMREQENAKKRKEEEEAKKEALRLELERKRKEEENARQSKADEERRLKEEREIAQRKAAEQERQRKLKEEKQERERKKAEEERQRMEKEAAVRERQRQLEEARREEQRRKDELERQRIAAEKERLRREEETRQRELERIREAERKAREAEERRITREWNDRVDQCRKILTLQRWKYRVPRCVELYEETKASLTQMKDVSISTNVPVSSPRARPTPPQPPKSPVAPNLRSTLDALIRSHLRFEDFSFLQKIDAVNRRSGMHLIKIACFFPESHDDEYNNLCLLVRRLVNVRLNFEAVRTLSNLNGETRLVFVDGSIAEKRSACDGVLILIPSGHSGIPSDAIRGLNSTIGDLPSVTAILTQNLGNMDESRQVYHALTTNSKTAELISNTTLSEEAVDNTLSLSLEALLKEVVQRPLPYIERIPLEQLGMLCINRVLWLESILESRDGLLEALKVALVVLAEELNEIGETGSQAWDWPSNEFFSDNGVVPGYFDDGIDLPANWHKTLLRENVYLPLQEMSFRLNGSMPHVLTKLLDEAPDDIAQECHRMFEHRMFRRCLQRALLWRQDNPEPWQTPTFVFMPHTWVERIIQRCVDAMKPPPTPEDQSVVKDTAALGTHPLTDTGNEENRLLPLVPVETRNNGSPTRQSLNESASPDNDTNVLLAWSPSGKRKATDSTGDDPQALIRRPSKRLRDSQAYTRRLEALASGNVVPRVLVGKQSLSSLLRQAPPPRDPEQE